MACVRRREALRARSGSTARRDRSRPPLAEAARRRAIVTKWITRTYHPGQLNRGAGGDVDATGQRRSEGRRAQSSRTDSRWSGPWAWPANGGVADRGVRKFVIRWWLREAFDLRHGRDEQLSKLDGIPRCLNVRAPPSRFDHQAGQLRVLEHRRDGAAAEERHLRLRARRRISDGAGDRRRARRAARLVEDPEHQIRWRELPQRFPARRSDRLREGR